MKKSLLLAAAALMVVGCSKRSFESVKDLPVVGPEGNEGLVSFSAGAGTSATSKVSTDGAADAHEGKNKFDAGDVIGVYALDHGATNLAAVATYPTGYQYLNKKYKAAAAVWDATAAGYIADFAPVNTVAGEDDIYYQAGGKEWNYLAYYPTSAVTKAGTVTVPTATLPSAATTASDVLGSKWVSTVTDYSFHNQVGIKDNENGTYGYPGPVMYAYFDAADKYTTVIDPPNGDPVALKFKHANAKLILNVTIAATVGKNTELQSVILYGGNTGTGLNAGYVYDLKNATTTTVADKGKVFVTNTAAPVLTGETRGADKLPEAGTEAYQFGFTKDAVDDDKAVSVGYLVPSAAVTHAKIEFFFKNAANVVYSYIAYLDQSSTGDSPYKDASGTNYMSSIEAGKVYTYDITINKYNVTFTGQITDWVDANSGGDAPEVPAE